MGSTFSNIHIKNKGFIKEDIQKRIIDWYQNKSYEICDQRPSNIDWPQSDFQERYDYMSSNVEICVLFNPESDWITIYSNAFEDINLIQGEQISDDFSLIFHSDALHTSIVDSDICMLILSNETFKHELFAAEYAPCYEGILPDSATENDIQKLNFLLENPTKSSELGAIWKKDYVFAEERLRDLIKCFGINEDCASLGYRYYMEDPSVIPKEFERIELYFRTKT